MYYKFCIWGNERQYYHKKKYIIFIINYCEKIYIPNIYYNIVKQCFCKIIKIKNSKNHDKYINILL